MNKKILITIAVLNFNGVKYLRKIIPSLLKQNYPNYEILIVDNGSKDDSIKYLKLLKSKKIRVVENNENYGYSKGKNICVKEAKGEYIFLIDNDILVKDIDFLTKLLNKNLDKKIYTFPLFDIDKDVTRDYGGYITYYGIKFGRFIPNKQIEIYKDNFKCSYPHGGAMFFKKKFWINEFGGYDDKQPFMLDDNDLGMRMWIYGYECLVANELPVIHLGVTNYLDNKYFSWRHKYYFSGFARSMLKNMKLYNFVYMIIFWFLFVLLKTIKNVFKRKSIKPLFSFIWSIFFFIKCLPSTLLERREIQERREVKSDIFLKIDSPDFN